MDFPKYNDLQYHEKDGKGGSLFLHSLRETSGQTTAILKVWWGNIKRMGARRQGGRVSNKGKSRRGSRVMGGTTPHGKRWEPTPKSLGGNEKSGRAAHLREKRKKVRSWDSMVEEGGFIKRGARRGGSERKGVLHELNATEEVGKEGRPLSLLSGTSRG